MKDYKTFINERVYYNSHGNSCPFSEVRRLEVDERENYPRAAFDEWQKKYNIKDDDTVIWVTPLKKQAYTYLLPSEYHDDILSKEEWEVQEWIDDKGIDEELYTIDDKQGFIIPESDDGDNGYLFVKR